MSKHFKNAVDAARELLGDETAKRVEEQIQKSRTVTALLILRHKQKLSVKELSTRCFILTEENINTIEAGNDDDISLIQLKDYIQGLVGISDI